MESWSIVYVSKINEMISSQNGHAEVGESLVDSYAKIDQVRDYGTTPLVVAS